MIKSLGCIYALVFVCLALTACGTQVVDQRQNLTATSNQNNQTGEQTNKPLPVSKLEWNGENFAGNDDLTFYSID